MKTTERRSKVKFNYKALKISYVVTDFHFLSLIITRHPLLNSIFVALGSGRLEEQMHAKGNS